MIRHKTGESGLGFTLKELCNANNGCAPGGRVDQEQCSAALARGGSVGKKTRQDNSVL